MAKKLVAVTNIKHNGDEFEAGSELDSSLFEKKQLEALYDAGAIELQDGEATMRSDSAQATNEGEQRLEAGGQQGAENQAKSTTVAPSSEAMKKGPDTAVSKPDNTKK